MAIQPEPIPGPPGLPLVGNVRDLDAENTMESLVELSHKYGPIFKLSVVGKTWIFVASHKLVQEVCDDKRFKKSIEGEIKELRHAVGDGLFTATGEDEVNWAVAHRVLVSAFGPLTIRSMFDEMHEIAGQLVLKWARQGSSISIDPSEDFTRLALDTIALCTMGFRFNSYYKEDMHPFISAMYAVLRTTGQRTMRVLPSMFFRATDKEYFANIKLLRKTAMDVLKARRESGEGLDRKDLLNAMLNSADPKTGLKMTDESIVNNLITFLIAGHETTASTLSFAIYQLIKHPDAYRKAQQEVDHVLGKEPMRVDHVLKLNYLTAVLRETLRHSSPIGGFGRQALKDDFIDGKYAVHGDGEMIAVLLPKAHFDPAVFGDDADKFSPERMYGDNFDTLMKEYPHCWSPFGTGVRACIGRAFAWQEMLTCLGLLLQNFNFVLDDPLYTLQVQQTLTTKPFNLKIRAILREQKSIPQLVSLVGGSAASSPQNHQPNGHPIPTKSKSTETGKRLAIFYGSDSGTCEYMAQKAASNAPSHGFNATVDSLDAAREALPVDLPVLIITASYEGQPPHNAGHFVSWIETSKPGSIGNVSYAVFGCGHADWAHTFHRIPKLVDSTLETLGAKRLAPLGSTDAKERDMFSDFESWEQDFFWPAVTKRFGGASSDAANLASNGVKVELSTPRLSALRQDVEEAAVVAAHSLVHDAQDGDVRHIEIKLPPNMVFSTGDYLAILPHNPKESIIRVMRRFNLAWDSHISIKGAVSTTLPTNTDVSVWDLLASYVELGQAATKGNMQALVGMAPNGEVKDSLQALLTESFDGLGKSQRGSVLDILEKFPSLQISLESFLVMLPPMRVRQYSISSCPMSDPTTATLTYGVLDEPSHSGQGRYIGVSTSFLASLGPGDAVQVAVRAARGTFRPPMESDKVPIICIAAGTGIAPFRAFIQERAIIRSTGRKLATALLFVGSRDAGHDLYQEELNEWEAAGAVKRYKAHSRNPGATEGCKYVQDRLWHERDTVVKLWNQNAKIYVCGSRKMAEGVEETLLRILEETEKDGVPSSRTERLAWFKSVSHGRYTTDVFD